MSLMSFFVQPSSAMTSSVVFVVMYGWLHVCTAIWLPVMYSSWRMAGRSSNREPIVKNVARRSCCAKYCSRFGVYGDGPSS